MSTDDDATPLAPQPLPLGVADAEVARYHAGTDLPLDLSPRPYLHPVRTPAGVDLTEIRPEDHRHHVGVSAAVVDVDGTTYWGGRSFVAGEGYVMLPNQGRQTGDEPHVVADGARTALTQRLRWTGPDGATQILEDREIRLARSAGPTAANLLTWRSTLHAQADLLLGSPATRGRTGAGYGGLFWRFGPEAGVEVTVRTADGVVTGEDAALGAVGPWLALTQHRAAGPVTVLLAQPAGDLLPWFVRVTGYTGAGPAVAWEQPSPLARGERRDLHLWAALTDTAVDTPDGDRLYRELEHLHT